MPHTKSSYCLIFLFMSAIAFVGVCLSQQPTDPSTLAESTKLPEPYSQFSEGEALKVIFDGYDRRSGRVANILNDQKKPSLVRVDIAKPWKVGNNNFLVVLTEIAAYDEQFGDLGLCGACAAVSPLGVLQLVNNKLKLVAKQENDFYTSANGDDQSTGYEAFWYTGHHVDVELDLAPYRLNEKEILIGIRSTKMWIPAFTYSTDLQLFRIERERIKKVFDDVVIDRDFPLGQDPLPIEKTISVLSTLPSNQAFYDLVVNKTTFRCFTRKIDTYDCQGGKVVNKKTETFRFNGNEFVKRAIGPG